MIEKLVDKLIQENKTIATMESCTGGGLANEITNIEGSSKVIKFSAVTYSNEFKIKMGVSKNIIDKYSVYSIKTANEMSENISKYANSTYGVGITGKLNRIDEDNPYGEDNIVFISVYDKDHNKFYNGKIKVTKNTRQENKRLVIEKAIEMLLSIDTTL